MCNKHTYGIKYIDAGKVNVLKLHNGFMYGELLFFFSYSNHKINRKNLTID